VAATAPRIPQFSLRAEKKGKISDHRQDEQADNEKSRKILTTRKSQNLVQTLSDGFLSLNAFLISISKCLLRFLRLGRCCFSRFLSTGLSGSGNILGFLGSLSLASRDTMRALAIAKASAAWQREKESQVENQGRKSARQAEGITQ
jgi:hypothetical protein